MVPLAYTSLLSKRHLDRFIRVCTAHLCAQHTVGEIVLTSGRVAGDGAGNSVDEKSGVFSPNPNALAAVMRLVKLLSGKTVPFLTESAGVLCSVI